MRYFRCEACKEEGNLNDINFREVKSKINEHLNYVTHYCSKRKTGVCSEITENYVARLK